MVNRRTFIAGVISAWVGGATAAKALVGPGRVLTAYKECSDYKDQIAVGQEVHWFDLVRWKDQGILQGYELTGLVHKHYPHKQPDGTLDGLFIWRDSFMVYFLWHPHCAYITIDGMYELIS